VRFRRGACVSLLGKQLRGDTLMFLRRQSLRSLSAVSGTIRRRRFRGMLDGRAPERFRYSDLKEADVEPSSYVF